MPTKNYPCDAAKFAKLRIALTDAGAPLTFTDPTENIGSFSPPSHPEIRLAFVFNGTDTLSITVAKEAWYETAGEVWNGLEPYLS